MNNCELNQNLLWFRNKCPDKASGMATNRPSAIDRRAPGSKEAMRGRATSMSLTFKGYVSHVTFTSNGRQLSAVINRRERSRARSTQSISINAVRSE